jgi:heme exporter protein B
VSRQFLAILTKDLLTEARRLQTLLSMLIFAVLVMIIVRYGFTPGTGNDVTVPAGFLWVVFAFAALLGFGRTFAQEREDGCMAGLLLCPVDRFVVFGSKTVSNLVFLALVQVVVVPVFAVFFLSQPGVRYLVCLPVVVLTDLGLAILGTLLATLVASARSRDILLPVVLLPFLVPLLIAATSATAAIIGQGASLGDVGGRLAFLAAYDMVFLVAAWGTYDYLLAE